MKSKAQWNEEGQLAWSEAQELMKKRSIFNKSARKTRILECLTKAANSWSAASNPEMAAQAYELAGARQMEEKEIVAAKGSYSQAALKYRESHLNTKAIEMYKAYVNIAYEQHHMREAGKGLHDIAMIYKETHDREQTIEHLRGAIDALSDSQNSQTELSNYRLELASELVEKGDFTDAAEIYENVGLEKVGNKLLKFSARNHFVPAFGCYMALGDYSVTKSALDRYLAADPTLAGTPEETLMRNLQDAAVDGDVEAFSAALYDFNRLKHMEGILIDIFQKAKDMLQGPDEESEESGSNEL